MEEEKKKPKKNYENKMNNEQQTFVGVVKTMEA